MQVHAVFCHIEFAADKRLYSGFFGFYIKLKGPVHGAMVCDCHCLHSKILGTLDKVIDADGTIEHGILGVNVKMNKRNGHKI
jgi:hypothetical protein